MDLDVRAELPPYDYVSPGFAIVRPDAAFPEMLVGDTRIPRWRWLRRWVEQNWYTDRRHRQNGFASRDEVSILHNAALLVRGKPCLEIGCWRGWSAVHIALGSGTLDVIDPILDDPDFAESIRKSCDAAGVLDAITFHASFSPAAVDALGYANGKKWSLIFVDGDHEGDAPRLDAEAAMRHAADSAMVMFHDLASPAVAAGLDAMRNAGWRTMVYHTMQIMGVAWRGEIEPPEHVPDPNVFWTLPKHLSGYHVSGWKRPAIRLDGGWWPGMTITDRRNAAMMRAQAAEDDATTLLADLDLARHSAAKLEDDVNRLNARIDQHSGEITTRDGRISELEARLSEADNERARLTSELAEMQVRTDRLAIEIADRNTRIEELSAAHAVEIDAIHARATRQRDALCAAHEHEIASLQASSIRQRDAHLRAAQDLYERQTDTQMRLRESLNGVAFAARWASDDAMLDEVARWLTNRNVLLGLLRRSAARRVAAVRGYAAGMRVDHAISDELLSWLLHWRTLFGLARRSKLSAEAVVAHRIGISQRQVRADQLGTLHNEISKLATDSSTPATERRTTDAEPHGTVTLANHLRDRGWGLNSPPFPGAPGGLLRKCFRYSALPEAAEVAWVKQVVRGWQPPGDMDAIQGAATRVRDSGLFDEAFYESQAGLSDPEIDPAIHYVLVGDPLGLSPSDAFDSGYYGDRNPDIVSAGMNRLLHYAEFGCHEGRHPRPMVSRRTNDSRMDGSRENVIVVTHEASRTGAPVLAWNIIQHLAANYNVFTIMLDGGPLMRDFEALSAEVHGPFDLDRRHSADIEHGLRPLLDAREYKYAIINSSESRPVVEACARRLIPTVMLMHEFGSYVHPPDSLRRAFDMASEIVFPADIVARSSLELHPPLRERPVRILPQGMSALPASGKLAPISPPPAVDELIRARANGAFIVLGAGTVDYRKGVDLFIATAMAVRRSPQAGRARFVWVGHGYRPTEDMRYSVYLHEQVERSELKDHVTFISEVSDLEPIYALADAFLLTSRLDPMPNVSIDAAHRGIPVICFRDASGTADLLMTDSETATGVVDYLDSSAAAQVIVSLISDSNYRSRMSEATRNLASSVFDMAKYVAALDQLGTDASARAAERRDDVNLLSRTDEFDPDICLGPDPTFEPRKSTARRAVVQNAMQRQTAVRRIMPGFNQHIWRAQRAGSEVPHRDPLAEFILTGHPCGPWFTPVIRPPEDSKSLAAGGLRALLHVHLSDPTQAGNLEMRLKANRLDADLLITTDDDAKADRLRGMFAASARGAVHIVAVSPETQDGSEIDWLLSEVQRPEWAAHSIIGHLHDTGINSDWAVTEFHWTALLGSRQPMFDCILDAFARQPTLGLVFPSDPLLPPPDNPRDFPTAGMFWAHRATLQSLADTDLPRSPRTLPFACDAAGLTQAVTRVPGVFL